VHFVGLSVVGNAKFYGEDGRFYFGFDLQFVPSLTGLT
jgi:hypothetical protein